MAGDFVIYNGDGRSVNGTAVLGERKPGAEALLLTTPPAGGDIFITFVRNDDDDEDAAQSFSLAVSVTDKGVKLQFHPGLASGLPHPMLEQNFPWGALDK